MALFDIKNIFNYLKCVKCNETPIIEINLDTLTLEGKCKNGHFLNNLSLSSFNEYYLKNSNCFFGKCNKCNYLFNDIENIFICLNCNKFYCNNCLKYRINQENHNNIINYNNKYSICKIHNSKCVNRNCVGIQLIPQMEFPTPIMHYELCITNGAL